jgi:hypothetical protein
VVKYFERLRGRDPESLAAFIVSLAQDSGPIGEQVPTFIVGTILQRRWNPYGRGSAPSEFLRSMTIGMRAVGRWAQASSSSWIRSRRW